MARRIILCVNLALWVSPVFAQTAFSGQVLDANRKPVGDALVVILETGTKAYTNERGQFSAEVPKPGSYTVRIIKGALYVQQRTEITFVNQALTFYAGVQGKEQEVSKEGIVVRGERDSPLSRYSLTGEEMKRLPGAYGDALSAIKTLPGVLPAQAIGALPTANVLGGGPPGSGFTRSAYSNSMSGFLVIRGGGTRANQYYFDGFSIPYPYHLGEQSSVLNNNMIRGVDIFTGAYPARFGNATGGIIDIQGPNENTKPGGEMDVSMFQSDIFAKTPLWGSDYLAAAFRQSYPNVALLKTYPDAIPADAKFATFRDGQLKLGFHFTSHQDLTVMYLGAHDLENYTKGVANLSTGKGGYTDALPAPNGVNTRPSAKFDRGFVTTGLRYRYQDENLTNSLFFEFNNFQESYDQKFTSPLTGETIFGFDVVDPHQQRRVRDDFSLEIVKNRFNINAGVETARHDLTLHLANIVISQTVSSQTPGFTNAFESLLQSNETFQALAAGESQVYNLNAGYVEMDIRIGRFRFTPGYRTEYYSLGHDVGRGPRGGLEFQIKETSTTLLAGGGQYFNAPSSVDQISPQSGNPELKMERSTHYSAGILQKFGETISLKIEGYHNVYSDLVTADNIIINPSTLRTNPFDLYYNSSDAGQNPLRKRNLNYSNSGTGDSSGVEVFLAKKDVPGPSGWFGWISYTRSITTRDNHQTRLDTTTQNSINSQNQNTKPSAYFQLGNNRLIYNQNGTYTFYYDNDKKQLYDLDRTHQFNAVFNYKFSPSYQLGGKWKYLSGTPYTPIIGNENLSLPGFVQQTLTTLTFLPANSPFYNSERLPPSHQLDLRLDHFFNYDWGHASYYIELINVYGRKNPNGTTYSAYYPYIQGVNPYYTYESTYLETPIGHGRRLRMPLPNVGLELKF